ncbi:MAG TPA: hypothetical protein VG222_01275, partial [Vicinamibacterales bacterium]|nr:hypothetical protein [Vicinamibacterales bacterium]
MIGRRGAAATLLCVTAVGASWAGGVAANVRAVLTGELRFSAQDFADLEQGKTVKHTLKGGTGEIAVVGAVRVRAPKARLIERVRDVAT